ncbi:MAG: hypothetical protein HOW73_51010 [Polyangiaceae bacterium]|nr:hypothetical protein [Polyangiaceae bacterium]
MTSDPRIYVVDQDHAIASWRNVYISIWRRNPSAERLRNLRSLTSRFLRETTGPVFAIVLVEEKCPVPDDAGRQHSVAFIRDLSPRASCIVLVFEGTGFMAAASRAVMVGLMSAAQFVIPYKVMQNVAEAERFLESTSPQQAPARGTLPAAVESIRSRISDFTIEQHP